MELRSFAQAALRAQCLSPETSVKAVRNTAYRWHQFSTHQTNRHFTSRRNQSSQAAARQLDPKSEDLPDTKTSSPQPQRSLDPSASQSASPEPPQSTSSARPGNPVNPKGNSAYASRFENVFRDAQPQRKSLLDTPAMQTLSAFNRSNSPASLFGSEWSPYGTAKPQVSAFDPSKLNLPRPPSVLSGGFDDVLPPAPDKPIVYPKLNAPLGRNVIVQKENLAEAMRKMEMLCATNGIRREFNKQRFHERPGLKRKRLASERWRKRFKGGFAHIVKRVQKFSRQGW